MMESPSQREQAEDEMQLMEREALDENNTEYLLWMSLLLHVQGVCS